MNELFEYLFSNKLGRYDLESDKFISSITEEKFEKLIIDINEIIVRNEDIIQSEFNFTCNSELSGDVFSCSCLECRIKSIDSLARFTTLYSDTVIITSPFYKYYRNYSYNTTVLEKFLEDIKILYYMQPLISEGLIKFSSGMVCVCKDCNEKLEETRSNYHHSVNKVLKPIKQNLLKSTTVKYTLDYGFPEFEITFPEEFADSQKQFLLISNSNYLLMLSKVFDINKNYMLTPKEIKKFGILENTYLDKVFNDIVDQRWIGHFYNTKYVTNRKVDLQILKSLNDNNKNINSQALIEGLTHEVPYIHNVNIEDLIDLRKNEFESFQIYRESIKKVVEVSSGLDSLKVKEAFNDLAKKELLKLDLIAKKSKKNLIKNNIREIVIGSAIVTGGLFTHTISPEIGAAISLLGGAKYLHQFASKLAQTIDEPVELSKNDMYYLWKVKELEKRK